ncbi:D-alanine--D-alanine ligase [Paenibacillus sp.]|uniref:D-alanine--D-alanine ligase n=1 Tax=Paenibacillus sp. TaxID=58172 RepID=UPI002D3D1FDB|nr:D-alanine--D-alanine ligase [Paenibacillus sp.]HZG83462.1 D-alanine--D-alanine ligase [Paenibacillus sp.]
MNKKIRVGIIYGGKSGEHDVSLSTAKAVIGEFDFDKYEVFPFYITKQGEWRAGAQLLAPVDDKKRLTFENGAVVGENSSALTPLFGALTGSTAAASAPAVSAAAAAPKEVLVAAAGGAVDAHEVDVVFPLLHGTFGEDGTIQGMLEMLNIPYVGAGVLASAVGMDKVAMKKMFASEGLPQCVYRYFTRSQWERDRSYYLMEIEMSLGYPCFVKPANLGSSVGVSKARNREELIEAVREALQFDRKVIVEEFVDAREIEVSVLGNDQPRASVPGEIASSSEFYDYKAKYIDGKSVMTIPADIPLETAQEAQELAIRAFQAIDGTGLSRVDFFLKKDDGKLLLNEINTLPGFTPFSMYPLLWKESGLTYRELLDELIRLAIERHQEKQSIKYGLDD